MTKKVIATQSPEGEVNEASLIGVSFIRAGPKRGKGSEGSRWIY